MSRKRKHESSQVDSVDLHKDTEKNFLEDEFHLDKILNESFELVDNQFHSKPTDLSTDSFSFDEKTEEETLKMSKRPKLCLNGSMDSPCSSSNSSLDVRDNSESPTLMNSVFSGDHTYVADDDSQPPTASLDKLPEITDLPQVTDFPDIIDLPEIIDLSTPARQGPSDVVDLTAEPTTPTFVNDVVDLTGDHSIDNTDAIPIIIGVNKIYERPSLLQQRPSCRFASASNNDGVQIINTHQPNPINTEEDTNKSDEANKSVISCPICFDDVNVLKRRKRQLNSTICGHVFCDKCITNAVKTQNKCPTCRKKLTLKQIHPLFL